MFVPYISQCSKGEGGHAKLVHEEFPKVSPASPGLGLKNKRSETLQIM